MPKEEKSYCVKLDDKMAEMIEVRRYGEIEGGFQRQLNTRVLGAIGRTAKAGEAIPPILVAKIEGKKYRLLDGQHRFEAWKQEHFDLWVQINPLRPMEAVKSFCTINGTARKLQLKDQLAVDPHPYTVKLRGLAMRFEIEPRIAHAIVGEVMGFLNGAQRQRNVPPEQWAFAEDFLKVWSNDPRWKAKGQIYSSYGCMLMAVKICKKSKDPLKTLTLVQQIDFGANAPLADRYGASRQSISQMADFAIKSLIRKGLI